MWLAQLPDQVTDDLVQNLTAFRKAVQAPHAWHQGWNSRRLNSAKNKQLEDFGHSRASTGSRRKQMGQAERLENSKNFRKSRSNISKRWAFIARTT
jgi:hypothetical protein